MNPPTAYHQLSQFIVGFQHLGNAVSNLLVLMANTDDGVVRILANDLEYGKRLNTADVLFKRFVGLRNNTRPEAKLEFHELMIDLRQLGERRNDLVHSKYNLWLNTAGKEGLLRTSAKLRGSTGDRVEKQEELQPEAFDMDLQRLDAAAARLERFRLQIIGWLYPVE